MTKFDTGRNYYLPAGKLNTVCEEKSLIFWSENDEIFLRNFQLLAGGFTDSHLLVGGISSGIKSSNFPVGSVVLTSTQPLKIGL
jgi:hypothetical protein